MSDREPQRMERGMPPGGQPAAAAPRAAGSAAHATEPNLATLRDWALKMLAERVISLKTMSGPLRAFCIVAAAQIALAAALIATREVAQPEISSVAGRMPLATFAFTALSVALALALVVTGALHSHPAIRWAGLAAVSIYLLWASTYVAFIVQDPFALTHAPVAVTALALLLLLGAIWGAGVYVTLANWRERRRGAAQPRERWVVFALVLALTLLYFALDWWSGIAVGEADVFPLDAGLAVEVLALVLIPTLVASSRAYGEWGELGATRVAAEASRLRSPWSVPTLTALTGLVALAILANVLRLEWSRLAAFGEQCAVALVGATLVALAARAGRVGHGAPGALPAWAPVAGLALLAVALEAAALASGLAPGSPGDQRAAALAIGLAAAPLAAAIGLGAWRLARGRRRGSASEAGWLYIIIIALLILLVIWRDLLAYAGVPTSALPVLSLPAIQVIVAAGTCVALTWLGARAIRAAPAPREARRAAGARVARLATLLLALNVGLQAIAWGFKVYENGEVSSGEAPGQYSILQAAQPLLAAFGAQPGQFSVLQAALPLLALLIGLALSGKSVTNTQGRIFPRVARVTFYLGYLVAMSATLLYFTVLRDAGTGAAILTGVESATWPILGLLFLGIALQVYNFTINWATSTGSGTR